MTGPPQQRYRAVRFRRGGLRQIWAGIEDSKAGQTTRVADPALAHYLALQLNALEAGGRLPPAGRQHRPRRFQLVHDVSFGSSTVGVMYVHGMHLRGLAAGASEETAQLIARILNHVDYPMIERKGIFPWTPRPPLVGLRGELPPALPWRRPRQRGVG